jgi:hypothetical protein
VWFLFTRFCLQVVASRTLMSEDLSAWRCQAAPRAEEVQWGSLGFRIWERAGEGAVRYGMVQCCTVRYSKQHIWAVH